MPSYEFENEDGVHEEHFLDYADAPSIGSFVMIDDRMLRRLPPSGLQLYVARDPHFIAWSQDQCDEKGQVPKGVVKAPEYDMDPKSPSYRFPRFDSTSDIKKYVSDSDGRLTYGK